MEARGGVTKQYQLIVQQTHPFSAAALTGQDCLVNALALELGEPSGARLCASGWLALVRRSGYKASASLNVGSGRGDIVGVRG